MIEILLDHSEIVRDEPDIKTIMHESIINRHREWVDFAEHWAFDVMINVHKYSDSLIKFNELYEQLGKEGILYRHRDCETTQADQKAPRIISLGIEAQGFSVLSSTNLIVIAG